MLLTRTTASEAAGSTRCVCCHANPGESAALTAALVVLVVLGMELVVLETLDVLVMVEELDVLLGRLLELDVEVDEVVATELSVNVSSVPSVTAASVVLLEEEVEELFEESVTVDVIEMLLLCAHTLRRSVDKQRRADVMDERGARRTMMQCSTFVCVRWRTMRGRAMVGVGRVDNRA